MNNPIRRVRGGYQWGTHGHVYPTYEGARRQAAAAYSHGYRGNPLTRNQQLVIAAAVAAALVGGIIFVATRPEPAAKLPPPPPPPNPVPTPNPQQQPPPPAPPPPVPVPNPQQQPAPIPPGPYVHGQEIVVVTGGALVSGVFPNPDAIPPIHSVPFAVTTNSSWYLELAGPPDASALVTALKSLDLQPQSVRYQGLITTRGFWEVVATYTGPPRTMPTFNPGAGIEIVFSQAL